MSVTEVNCLLNTCVNIFGTPDMHYLLLRNATDSLVMSALHCAITCNQTTGTLVHKNCDVFFCGAVRFRAICIFRKNCLASWVTEQSMQQIVEWFAVKLLLTLFTAVQMDVYQLLCFSFFIYWLSSMSSNDALMSFVEQLQWYGVWPVKLVH